MFPFPSKGINSAGNTFCPTQVDGYFGYDVAVTNFGQTDG